MRPSAWRAPTRALDRAGIPAGTMAAGIGLGIAGLCAYGFLTISGRALGPVRYSQLSVLWSATFLLGTGLFLPLEQEMARALSARRTRGEPVGAVVLRGARVAAVFLAVLATGLLLARGAIVTRFFDGDSTFLLALAGGLLSLAAGYLARGYLSGTEQFGRYGVLNAAEGLLRLVPALILAALGVGLGLPYGLAFALAPLFAAALAAGGPLRSIEAGPPPRRGELNLSLAKLVAASLLGQALINLPVLMVKFLATAAQGALAGRFMAGVVVARVPVVLFSAVQAAIVPRLSALHAMSQPAEFRRVLGKLGLAIGAIGTASTLFLWTLGAPVVTLFFGEGFRLQPADLAFLGAGSAFYLLALALSQGLIALGSYSPLMAGWSIGLTAGGTVTAMNGELLLRVERGFLAGSIAACVAMAVLVFRAVRVAASEPALDPSALPSFEAV